MRLPKYNKVELHPLQQQQGEDFQYYQQKMLTDNLTSWSMTLYNATPTTGKYRMRLTLNDSTTKIDAYVIAKNGETLFYGYPVTKKLRRKAK